VRIDSGRGNAKAARRQHRSANPPVTPTARNWPAPRHPPVGGAPR